MLYFGNVSSYVIKSKKLPGVIQTSKTPILGIRYIRLWRKNFPYTWETIYGRPQDITGINWYSRGVQESYHAKVF